MAKAASDKKVDKKVKKQTSKAVLKEPTKHAKPASSKDILAKANVTPRRYLSFPSNPASGLQKVKACPQEGQLVVF